MVNLENKTNSIPDADLAAMGMTREGLLYKQKQENAALLMCGGLLGDCYIMQEIISWMLDRNGLDIYNKIKEQKWFKQKIKKNINMAIGELNAIIKMTKDNSISDTDYMQDIADGMYDELKLEIIRLKNSFTLYIGRFNIKNPDIVADFFMIDTLLSWIPFYYDEVIAKMKTVYPAYYNSWYFQAKCEGPSKKWNIAVHEFDKQYINEEMDLNESNMILGGINAFIRKLQDPNVCSKVRDRAMDYVDDSKSFEAFSDSMKILDIKPVEKTEEPTSPPCAYKKETMEEAINRLSERFKVRKTC